MADYRQVIELHRKYPQLTAAQIAERLGCLPAYVRAVAQRNLFKLPGSRPVKRSPQPRVHPQ